MKTNGQKKMAHAFTIGRIDYWESRNNENDNILSDVVLVKHEVPHGVFLAFESEEDVRAALHSGWIRFKFGDSKTIKETDVRAELVDE